VFSFDDHVWLLIVRGTTHSSATRPKIIHGGIGERSNVLDGRIKIDGRVEMCTANLSTFQGGDRIQKRLELLCNVSISLEFAFSLQFGIFSFPSEGINGQLLFFQ
jgi:hypothetical protein